MKKILIISLFLIGFFGVSQSQIQVLRKVAEQQNTATVSGTIYLVDSLIMARPTATGHGKFTTGGRQKPVYFVDNLNDSGSGSYRQAIADCVASDGGNIILRIGGVVTLLSDIEYDADNITVYGESAPGDGFATYEDETVVLGENIIIRNMTFFGGDAISGANPHEDTFRIMNQFQTGTHQNYFIDQNSFYWGGDETVAFESNDDGSVLIEKISFTNNIVAEPFGNKNFIAYGSGQTEFSIIGNLFANGEERSPRLNFDSSNNTLKSEFEVHNNFVHAYNAALVVFEGVDFDAIGNVFQEAYASPSNGEIRIVDPSSIRTDNSTDYYLLDNIAEGGAASKTDDSGAGSGTNAGSRQFSSGYAPTSSSLVETHVTTKAGSRALMGNSNSKDLHMISDVINGSSGAFGSTEAASGGLPTLTNGTPYTDSDNDGLSDFFEARNPGVNHDDVEDVYYFNGYQVDQATNTTAATLSRRYTALQAFMIDREQGQNGWGQ